MGGGGPDAPDPTQQELNIFEEQLQLMDLEEARIRAELPLIQQRIDIQKQQLDALIGEDGGTGQLAQQIQIAQQQLDLAQQAFTDQASLRPFVLNSLGLTEDAGVAGGIRRMTEDEFRNTLDDATRLGRENLVLALEREQRALKGELPVSEGLRQQKEQAFQTFKEQQARVGNPITGNTPETAIATTTGGVQALKGFNEQFGYLEDIERRGELSGLAETNLARRATEAQLGATRRAGLLDFPRTTGVFGGLNVGTGAGGVGGGGGGIGPAQLAGAYGGLLEPLEAQRALQFSAEQAQAAQLRQRNQIIGSAAGGVVGGVVGSVVPVVGTAAGAAIGAGVGGAAGYSISDPKYKKDIRRATPAQERKALEMVRDMKTHTFRYKGERGAKRMGPMAPALPRALRSPNGEAIDVGRMMGMLTAAVRELDRRQRNA